MILGVEGGRNDPALHATACPACGSVGDFRPHSPYRRNLEDLETARKSVRGFIDGYGDERVYSWVMDIDGVAVGTIGAYDYKGDRIEVGFSVVKGWRGRGLATEALGKVLEYLTGSEGIPRVTAWCAAENVGSQKV